MTRLGLLAALIMISGCAEMLTSKKAARVAVYEPGESPHPRCRLIGIESASGKLEDTALNTLRERAADRGANNLRLINRDQSASGGNHNGVLNGRAISANASPTESTELVAELYFCPDA